MIRDLPYTTSEQVFRLRQAAIETEAELIKAEELMCVERERAEALAAHVERLRKIGDELGYWLSAAIEDPKSCDEFKEACNKHLKAIHESPETSLAQRDARVAAGALRGTAEQIIRCESISVPDVVAYINKLAKDIEQGGYGEG